MKYFYILVFFALCASITEAQGVSFEDASWTDVLAKAKKENKLIFMDAYTTWCGPCKQMSKKVFTSKKVGDFYNSKFINVKIDMEKGQGPSLKEKFDVLMYPTLLYIDWNGTLVHRATGYLSVKDFIAEGDKAIDPKNSMMAMDTKYNEGSRDEEFLLTYLQTKYTAGDGTHLPILSEFLKGQDDWSSPQNLELIYQMTESTDSDEFKYMVENQTDFENHFGKTEMVRQIQTLVFSKIQNTTDISMEEIGDLFKLSYPNEAERMTSQYRMTYYRQKGDRKNFAESAIDHYSRFDTNDPGELNDVAWTFYEAINDNKMLKKACKLATKSIKMEKAHYNMDTLASLNYKMGKYSKSLKIAKKAIAIAEANNQDYSSTNLLIEKIVEAQSAK